MNYPRQANGSVKERRNPASQERNPTITHHLAVSCPVRQLVVVSFGSGGGSSPQCETQTTRILTSRL